MMVMKVRMDERRRRGQAVCWWERPSGVNGRKISKGDAARQTEAQGDRPSAAQPLRVWRAADFVVGEIA